MILYRCGKDEVSGTVAPREFVQFKGTLETSVKSVHTIDFNYVVAQDHYVFR